MLYAHRYASPLGGITMASDGRALTGLWFDGQRTMPKGLPAPSDDSTPEVFVEADQWLDRYFSGEIPGTPPALSPQGSAFRQAVWALLMKIPYGETTTYGGLARALAAEKGLSRMSAQAVGGAVAHNPISIIIPCHRVLGANGALTGYAGGLERKRWLLDLESPRTRA